MFLYFLIVLSIRSIFIFNHSDKVELALQLLAQLLIFQDFTVELGTFLCVLKDSRYFNWSSPVDIVEALREDQLLQHSFFHFRVWKNHSVVIGDSWASIWRLRDNIEVIIFRDNFWGYHCSCWKISDLPSFSEKPFWCFNINHDHGESRCFFFIDLFKFGFEGLDVVIEEHDDLIVGWRAVENDDLSWHFFVSVSIGLNSFQT